MFETIALKRYTARWHNRQKTISITYESVSVLIVALIIRLRFESFSG